MVFPQDCQSKGSPLIWRLFLGDPSKCRRSSWSPFKTKKGRCPQKTTPILSKKLHKITEETTLPLPAQAEAAGGGGVGHRRGSAAVLHRHGAGAGGGLTRRVRAHVGHLNPEFQQPSPMNNQWGVLRICLVKAWSLEARGGC